MALEQSYAIFGLTILLMVIVFLVLKNRWETVLKQKIQQISLENITLKERLTLSDSRVTELKLEVESCKQEIGQLRDCLTDEQQKKSAAEEKVLLIPELQRELQVREENNYNLLEQNALLREKLAELETVLQKERQQNGEKLQLLNDAQALMTDAFKALSAEALARNNQSFMNLAQATLEKYQDGARNDLESRQKAINSLIAPFQESLKKVDEQIRSIEKERERSFGSLSEQLKQVAGSQNQLQAETANLVKALRVPNVRGRWGEIQLKRVVEIAGMVEYCDFSRQDTLLSDSGKLRPDMLIRLPNQKVVVVDSKTPLQAYLEAVEAVDDNVRQAKMIEHARQVKSHVNNLAGKSYWNQINPAPEFAVLFLPGESFFSAALEVDPGLIEYGAEQKIIIATPTTLIALLRAVAFGWQQERIAANAEQISELGKILYERLKTMNEHFINMKKGLEKAVESYNNAMGSYEGRVLVAARRFKELGASGQAELEIINSVDKSLRAIDSENPLTIEDVDKMSKYCDN
ncbi:MAG: DNA recombination protein RmuC [Syntrophomonadaceae bacterium]|jgi:DNA recombination protein RmuC